MNTQTQKALKMAIKEMTDAIPHLDIHFDDYFEAIQACKEALAEHEAWQKQIQYAKAHITKQQMMEKNPLSGQYKGGRFDD